MSILLNFFSTLIITIIIVCMQKYLSTKKAWQLGAIVPLISIIVFAYIYFVSSIQIAEFLVPCTIILILELVIWIDGRHQYRKEELNKMKVKDL